MKNQLYKFFSFSKMSETWEDTAPVAASEIPEIKLFGRWSSDDVQVSDISLTVS